MCSANHGQILDVTLCPNFACINLDILSPVSLGFFDDILIPPEALQQPAKLYPLKSSSLLDTLKCIMTTASHTTRQKKVVVITFLTIVSNISIEFNFPALYHNTNLGIDKSFHFDFYI